MNFNAEGIIQVFKNVIQKTKEMGQQGIDKINDPEFRQRTKDNIKGVAIKTKDMTVGAFNSIKNSETTQKLSTGIQ